MNRAQPLSGILLLAVAATSSAQSSSPEELLVTGSYAPQAAITASSSVLGVEDISAANKRSLPDLLKTLPGLLVEEQGGPGGLTAVSIRGGESNFTQVLLNGVPINDPTNTRGGGFDLANLNSTLIERIEVVRGAQSAVYGSDAVAGVINIITRRPVVGHRQSVAVTLGEDEFSDISFSALGREGSLDYSVELVARDEGEPIEGSRRDTDIGSLRLEWRPGFRHAFNLDVRYLEGERSSYPEQSGGPALAVSDALDSAEYEDTVLSARWRAAISDGWSSDLQASYFEHSEDFRSPGIVPFSEVPPNASDATIERSEARWVNSLSLASGYRLDVGADFRREQGDSRGFVEFSGIRLPTDFELDRDNTGVFASLNATPRDGFLFDASVRVDDPDDFSSETTWRMGAALPLSGTLALAVNWGEAFKLPSFFALGNGLVGNPDLKPERNDSWDVGLRWQAGSRWSLQLTAFLNEFTDLIDFDDEAFTNVNRRSVDTSGVELEAHWSPTETVRARFSGTYTDIDVQDEDTVLTGRPQWLAGAIFHWQFRTDWEATLDYRYSGSQWATSRHTGVAISERLDSYHRFDAAFSWAPSERWQLRLALDNLLDEDYETAVGFQAPGRAARVGVQLHF